MYTLTPGKQYLTSKIQYTDNILTLINHCLSFLKEDSAVTGWLLIVVHSQFNCLFFFSVTDIQKEFDEW